MRERERDSYTSQYKHKAIGNSTCLSLLLVPAALHWLDDLIFSGGHKAGTHRKSATSNHDNNKTTTNINHNNHNDMHMRVGNLQHFESGPQVSATPHRYSG